MLNHRLVALLVAALPCTSYSMPTTHWAFALSVMRWKSPDCHEVLSMEGPTGGVHIKQGDCHTWDDGKNFPSLTYSWENNTRFQELRSDRTCAVLVYEKDECYGHLLAVNDHVNTWKSLGNCWHWEGIPGRSIKLKCRKTGTDPHWGPETHWDHAESENKHEDEVDVHGNPVDPYHKAA
ncbi:unnamed protein product [Zymoseptoria tritici ST99CH_3D1]|nr:unnamed protein product [Zymoseptoria tritici ST99CH_3D1]